MKNVLKKCFLQADKTFSVTNKDFFSNNLALLIRLVDGLSLNDVAINPRHVSKAGFQKPEKAPCTFISICEKEKFSMSVFIINAQYTMPIHDHPNMKGILKVISGKLKIQSYTRLPSNDDGVILVSSNEPKILDSSSPATFLDESNNNYHEITALDQPAAFFDVLSPPYSEYGDENPSASHCHFYRKLMIDNESETKTLKLEMIPCPAHYFCDQLNFEQPDYMT